MKKRRVWLNYMRQQEEKVDEQILWQKKIIREENRKEVRSCQN